MLLRCGRSQHESQRNDDRHYDPCNYMLSHGHWVVNWKARTEIPQTQNVIKRTYSMLGETEQPPQTPCNRISQHQRNKPTTMYFSPLPRPTDTNSGAPADDNSNGWPYDMLLEGIHETCSAKYNANVADICYFTITLVSHSNYMEITSSVCPRSGCIVPAK